MVPHGNSSKHLPAGGSFLSGLRREDTGIQSRPNDPDRERKHAKTEVYYHCYDKGWEPHSWGGVRNGRSFLYNALAVYACGGGASVSDLMERPTPLPPSSWRGVYGAILQQPQDSQAQGQGRNWKVSQHGRSSQPTHAHAWFLACGLWPLGRLF